MIGDHIPLPDLARMRQRSVMRVRNAPLVRIRVPEADETGLSPAEVEHGLRRGLFNGYAPARAFAGAQA